jgi:squalene cyclase
MAGLSLTAAESTGLPDRQFLRRAREARVKALDRLIEKQNDDGHWFDPVYANALCNSMYIMTLRTTGLIGEDGAPAAEAEVVRHLLTLTNPDGGFYSYPGGGSSRSLTRIALLALRLAIGGVQPGGRPADWFTANPELRGELEERVKRTVARAGRFLRSGKCGAGQSLELIYVYVLFMLRWAVEPSRLIAPMPLYQPELAALFVRSRSLVGFRKQFGHLFRRGLPAAVLLYDQARKCQPVWGRIVKGLHLLPWFGRWAERSREELVTHLRQSQGSAGGWALSTVQTMFNMMALRSSGIASEDPCFARAREFLAGRVFPAEHGVAVDQMATDVWNTGHALCTYLAVPGHTASDGAARAALENLLDWQYPDGSWGWFSGFEGDGDVDSTGLCLKALSMAARGEPERLRARIERARVDAQRFLRAHQDQDGGFSPWHGTLWRCRPGALTWVNQLFLDTATADVAGRLVEYCADAGLSSGDPLIERTLGFLGRTQCPDGSWWSRWWAGYVVGTAYVLRGLGAAGLRVDEAPPSGPRRLAEAHAGMSAGVRFLLRHQNADGGWGETVEADSRPTMAGQGPSTPLQTALVLVGLLRVGVPASSPAVGRGIGWLLDAMSPDGRWQDDQSTFTIASCGWYYPFPFYNYIFPLEALTFLLESVDGQRAGREYGLVASAAGADA